LGVKKNQPKLHRQIKKNIKKSKPLDANKTIEKSRNRQETRVVKVYANLTIDITFRNSTKYDIINT